jgi:hypothetical protein
LGAGKNPHRKPDSGRFSIVVEAGKGDNRPKNDYLSKAVKGGLTFKS